jgi:hypothetical protein
MNILITSLPRYFLSRVDRPDIARKLQKEDELKFTKLFEKYLTFVATNPNFDNKACEELYKIIHVAYQDQIFTGFTISVRETKVSYVILPSTLILFIYYSKTKVIEI